MAKRKAVMVEEGTENLLNNPLFSTTSNWSFTTNGGGSFTVANNWGKITKGTGTYDFIRQTISRSGNSGDKYTLQFKFKNNVTGQAGIRTGCIGAGETAKKITFDGTGGYIIVSVTHTATAAYTQVYADVILGTAYGHNPPADFVEFSYAQLEAKPYATSFIDGTRSPETLTIPTEGVLNPQEGTIEFWWNPLAKTPQTFPSLIATGQWTNPITQDWLAIHWGSGWSNANTVTFAMYNKNGTNNFNRSVTLNPQPYTWYYVTAKWSFVTRIAKLIIYRPDGTYVSTQATINGEPPTFEGWDKFYILQTWNNGAHRANSLIDDLRISQRARTDEEILAAYREVT